MHEPEIEADIQRVIKLAQQITERSYGVADRDELANFRFESFAIIGIVTFDDDNGDAVEDEVAVFESKRHHVQTGILVDLLVSHISMQFHGRDEDEHN